MEEIKVCVEIDDVFWSLAVGLRYLHESNAIHGRLDLSKVLVFYLGQQRVNCLIMDCIAGIEQMRRILNSLPGNSNLIYFTWC